MNGFEECPHCHVQVFVGQRGECPSCRRNTKDGFGASPDLRRVEVRHGEALPLLCCSCGIQTDRDEQLKLSSRRGGDPWPMRVLFWLCVPFQLKLLAHREQVTGEVLNMELDVRRCGTCAKTGPMSHEYVDFDQGTVTLLVHRTYAKKLRLLRKRRAARAQSA